LPFDVQLALVHSMRGWKTPTSCPGYAIEYDYFDPRALKLRWKPSRSRPVLRRPDQRTTGMKGGSASMLAGLNARCKHRSAMPDSRRDEAYLGVLVDDLITRACKSHTACSPAVPNTVSACAKTMRLAPDRDRRQLGCVGDAQWAQFEKSAKRWRSRWSACVRPGSIRASWRKPKQSVCWQGHRTRILAGRPVAPSKRSYDQLMTLKAWMPGPGGPGVQDDTVKEQVEIQVNTPVISTARRKK